MKDSLETIIEREISFILKEKVKDHDIEFVTITNCNLSGDMGVAKVYYTVLNDERRSEIAKALDGATGFIRTELAGRVEMKKVPEIRFLYDESIAQGQRIEQIIKELNEQKEN